MNRIHVCIISAAVLTGAAGLASLIATAQQRQGPIFIAGDQPVTEDQVREELKTEGWSNIKIVRQGRYFEVSATKNEQIGKLAVDSQTGRLRANEDDDDDD
jgi:UDP-N-acetyl-D-mannosaminuronic acid transferase (WecB/TagA/CpsF family)